MTEVSGFVNRVNATAWNDKILHGFSISGDDRLFGTGLDKPALVTEGAHIRFTAERNDKGRWNVKASQIEKLGEGDIQAGVSVASATKPNGKDNAPYRDAKGLVIEQQSCRNSAIAWVTALLENDLISKPKTVKDRYDWANNLLDHTVEAFVKENAIVRDPSLAVVEETDVPPIPSTAVGGEELKEEDPWDKS